MLDIDFANILYTVINILLLCLIFRIFLFKRVDKILNERKQEADYANEDAVKKAKEADEARKKYEEELNSFNDKRDDLMRQTKDEAYREHEKILDEARVQALEILDEAKVNAKIESERQKKVYEAELKEMVVDAASKIAATSHTEESDKLLYDKFIEEAKGVKNNEAK
ncbi:MAG: ATP synthase F0 subunit B [Butyrivibrio sp.]|nr:ATP synthase F0 subunit B [Butyrivibrio sp.]